MDTGCKHDLTTRDAIPYCQLGVITKSRNPVLLSTANDIISSDMIVPQQIGALGINAEPYVLDQSLDVLSIGRRCVQDGYSFQWLPYSPAPTLVCPSGKIVKLRSRDGCPYLDDYEPNERSAAAPAVVPKQPTTDLRRTDVVICEGRGDTYDAWGTPEGKTGARTAVWDSSRCCS